MYRFVFVLLPTADGYASAVQYSTLSLFDDDVKVHKYCFWGLTSKRVKCDKAYSLNSKPLPIKNRQAPFKPNFFILLSPQPPVFRIPPGTSPPSEGLEEAPSQDLFSHPYPTVSSHIPSSGGAWGGSFSLVFGLPSLVRALLLFVNFFPFRFSIYALLDSKRACFATQKGTFYNPLCNLLILRRLQRRFLMIIS